ncbi:MAG: NAD(P)/FAD-dependent oxidoreductase [Prevotella sp.]|nr:NAD(P)/FAD-dependent oxidoreductase [Prevotella sp.]
MRTAIVGGGAAGFFLAINLKEMMPEMEVTIFERSKHVLSKVRISGGGRCNCTNSFQQVSNLADVYPRGHRLMKNLFHHFDYVDAYDWFERHGVPLTTQEDCCVFPQSQDSQTIINCFLTETRRNGVIIRTGTAINSLSELADYNFIAVTTGGSPSGKGLNWLSEAGIEIVEPVPSLFTFSIKDSALHSLMGTVVEASVMLPGTKMHASGPLLVTHWGMSGPAILRLSSYAAHLLHEHNYQMPLAVNWANSSLEEVREEFLDIEQNHPQKLLSSIRPFSLPSRLWDYLLSKALESTKLPWGQLGKKQLNRLVNILTNDTYAISGRAPFKDEFVTCGGVALSAVHSSTLESRQREGLYFAGEVLDVDGVTGGFNFQAAWTTAYTVAEAISGKHF